jgi:hypothetical protein
MILLYKLSYCPIALIHIVLNIEMNMKDYETQKPIPMTMYVVIRVIFMFVQYPLVLRRNIILMTNFTKTNTILIYISMIASM